jgi:hypothetical protein
MAALTQHDYKQILEYYKMSIPSNKKQMKHDAEKIIAEKLCKCIKKLDPENESRSIGICTKTVINRKGFVRGNFQCKKKRVVTLKRRISRVKTRRRLIK